MFEVEPRKWSHRPVRPLTAYEVTILFASILHNLTCRFTSLLRGKKLTRIIEHSDILKSNEEGPSSTAWRSPAAPHSALRCNPCGLLSH
jgi:hypothetical protein